MKRIIIIAFLSVLAHNVYAQLQSSIGVFAGAGASTKYNYDVGLAGGLSYTKQVGGRTCLGAIAFYQGYNYLFDHESYYVNNGGGNAGVTVLNKSSYMFVAPKISQFFGSRGSIEAYVNFGAGFMMSGTETMRKWDKSYGTVTANYDSTINTSKNLNSMAFRIGVGLTEHMHMGKNWWFSVTEDCGFLTSSLSKTSDFDNPSRTPYSPNGKLNPNYFSLHIGITHVKLRIAH